MMRFCGFFIFIFFGIVKAQYEPPKPEIEVVSPRGFKVSIPYEEGIEIFAFHGSVNKEIYGREAGTFNVDITKPIDGKLTYWERTTKLKPGDVINYWTYVQFLGLGYPIDGLKYVVPGNKETNCTASITIVNGEKTCLGKLIFEEGFDGSEIDFSKWIAEHRIPFFSKLDGDSKFNSYENRREYRFVKDSKLYLKPTLVPEENVRGVLDLREGCTGLTDLECIYEQKSVFLLPPVKSARINSKLSFKYGKIEVKAKLPSGSWIFPEIQLLPKDKNINEIQRMWIAYVRGNVHLITANGEEIGATKLYGGPVEDLVEPMRSKKLLSKTSSIPYNRDVHTFTLLWTSDTTSLSVDGINYGSTNTDFPFKNKEFYVSLGVGVGGSVDFPDGCSSEGKRKPWSNTERGLIKKFFESKPEWENTWTGDEVALQVDSVKIWAV